MNLGNRIRVLRKEKKCSIMNINQLTGLSKSTISQIENGQSSPTVQTLEKIAKALDVTIGMFFKENEKEIFDGNSIEFISPQEAMQFILKQGIISDLVGFDINKLSDEEFIEFNDNLLRQLQLLSYKYKR